MLVSGAFVTGSPPPAKIFFHKLLYSRFHIVTIKGIREDTQALPKNKRKGGTMPEERNWRETKTNNTIRNWVRK